MGIADTYMHISYKGVGLGHGNSRTFQRYMDIHDTLTRLWG